MRALLFDMDGVLVDSRRNMELSWSSVRDKFPHAPPFEDYFAHIGKSFPDILTSIGMSEERGTIESTYKTASIMNMREVKFFDGIDEMLEEISRRGILMGVVTSKDSYRTEKILNGRMKMFSSIQCPNGRMRGKPAPDYLLVAMAQIGVDPKDAAYVGDMAVDMEAAERAGCWYGHAGWGYGVGVVVEPLYPTFNNPGELVAWASSE